MSHLVSATELADLLREDAVRVIDVRWRLSAPGGGEMFDGRAEYLQGHIPGAVFADLEEELTRHGLPEEGRHPLPTTAQVQDAARRWGVNDGDLVVAYDDAGGLPAARAWWLLRQGGVDVRVLDGGWRAWQAAGGDIESGSVEYAPGAVTLHDVTGDSLTIDEAAAFPQTGVLLDVRAPERFRGETEPLDPIAGHIPGAVNLPTTRHVAEDGTLLDLETLRRSFAEVGVSDGTPVAAYCGSGITAAHTALVLAEAGIDAKIFHGSWSQWSNTPGHPVAVGD
ncbi:thiosulfate/3-mercaptopyruvate sulfurtransferase [Microbacterium ginsengiterrae]|uniref:Thiosulfate/3-mercaptopyruvate sulfurtransferase n=1 Tax=Microbacterium ginsengiterrae TaxID=546115 RepID=A0A7W9CBP6_9MICO|nr:MULTISPECIES: sulfurtransferase [Microbacterium]MBB5742658.1 thiosulfate/3-mercaptopyruvate sulfurtransferase [Microbacterium ginsengiterrae]